MLISSFIDYIKKEISNYSPKVILDIGSRDLDQSIEFNTTYPGSKIYAFEPNPEQFAICNEKAQAYPNIEVFNIAISDTEGTLDFYKTLGNIGASSLLEPIDVPFASSQEVQKISVQAKTLKTWIEEEKPGKIDIMWMDTQGTELAALKSMGDYLKGVKFLHCEASESPYYKGHILKTELEAFLDSMGFNIYFYPAPHHPYGEGDIIASNRAL